MHTETTDPQATIPSATPPFTFANRAGRFCWQIVWTLLIRCSPRPCHGWRAMWLRAFGARLGRACHIYPGARIWAPWNLTCGDETAIADGAIIYNQAAIILGKRVVISQGAHLCTGTHLYNEPSFRLVAFPIVVENFAWIAAEAFVHPGVTIREGAVIGARSVVLGEMPPWMVCAGHPCIPIKERTKLF